MDNLIVGIAIWIAINIAIGIWLLSGRSRSSNSSIRASLRNAIIRSTTEQQIAQPTEIAIQNGTAERIDGRTREKVAPNADMTVPR